MCCWGGAVAQWVERLICDQQVVGSNPSGQKLRNNLGQVVPTYVPLSPSSISWYTVQGAVMGGWLIVTCGLTACIHRDQLRAQRSATSMGSLYLYFYRVLSSSSSSPSSSSCVVVFQPRERGNTRLHKIHNVQIALNFLTHKRVGRHSSS